MVVMVMCEREIGNLQGQDFLLLHKKKNLETESLKRLTTTGKVMIMIMMIISTKSINYNKALKY